MFPSCCSCRCLLSVCFFIIIFFVIVCVFGCGGILIFGVDTVDLPQHAAARSNPVHAMENLLFNGDDEQIAHAGSLSQVAKAAVASRKSVSASLAGKLYTAVEDPYTVGLCTLNQVDP
jgi:hypothetical protein